MMDDCKQCSSYGVYLWRNEISSVCVESCLLGRPRTSGKCRYYTTKDDGE